MGSLYIQNIEHYNINNIPNKTLNHPSLVHSVLSSSCFTRPCISKLMNSSDSQSSQNPGSIHWYDLKGL